VTRDEPLVAQRSAAARNTSNLGVRRGSSAQGSVPSRASTLAVGGYRAPPPRALRRARLLVGLPQRQCYGFVVIHGGFHLADPARKRTIAGRPIARSSRGQALGSRRDAEKLMRKGRVALDGVTGQDPRHQGDENQSSR